MSPPAGRSRAVVASKQSRYLRDVSRAVEALVLSAWYGTQPGAQPGTTYQSGVQPSSHLQAQLHALHCSAEGDASTAPVLAELFDVASYVLETDGTLGPGRGSSRPPELRAAMSEGISQAVRTVDGLRGLANLLGLDAVPSVLSTFDISHLYGTHTVGACSVLSLGMTALDDYRCYPIRGVTPADDYGAIEAALREHLCSAERPPPGLLLIDGGKGQLSAATAVLSELGLQEAVAPLALAKREEEIYLPHRDVPVVLPRTSPTLTLLRRQRDEAHAFALLSHRRLRASSLLSSVLDGVGLRAAEQAQLRAAYGSASALRAASIEGVGAALGEGASVDPRLVLSAVRAQPEPLAVGFEASLAGHPSAVQALALSARRANPQVVACGRPATPLDGFWLIPIRLLRISSQVEAWGREEQARKWWSVRRGPWLARLERGGKAAERAVDEVLEAVEAVLAPTLAPATPIATSTATPRPMRPVEAGAASARLARALGSWASKGALLQASRAEVQSARPPPISEAEVPISEVEVPISEAEVPTSTASSASSVVAMPGAFKLHAPYPAAGDQPSAIESLVADVQAGVPRAVLKGATGTGKTFVLANLIERTNRPTLIVAPNKVLVSQLLCELMLFHDLRRASLTSPTFDDLPRRRSSQRSSSASSSSSSHRTR